MAKMDGISKIIKKQFYEFRRKSSEVNLLEQIEGNIAYIDGKYANECKWIYQQELKTWKEQKGKIAFGYSKKAEDLWGQKYHDEWAVWAGRLSGLCNSYFMHHTWRRFVNNERSESKHKMRLKECLRLEEKDFPDIDYFFSKHNCKFVQKKVLDFDVRKRTLSGELSMNGKVFPIVLKIAHEENLPYESQLYNLSADNAHFKTPKTLFYDVHRGLQWMVMSEVGDTELSQLFNESTRKEHNMTLDGLVIKITGSLDNLYEHLEKKMQKKDTDNTRRLEGIMGKKSIQERRKLRINLKKEYDKAMESKEISAKEKISLTARYQSYKSDLLSHMRARTFSSRYKWKSEYKDHNVYAS
jgi:hypothetical protein